MNTKIRVCAVQSLVLFLCTVSNVWSQGGEIVAPEVEVIGTKENLERIPGSGEIIDNRVIEDTHPFTINEVLRKAAGINVRDEEGIGLRPNIGIRGLNPTRSTKVLLLEDGIPLAYAPYGDNASYYHPPIERFERIEILKGAGLIMYGPQTIGGLINYVTPDPAVEPGGQLTLSGGNRDYLSGKARLTGHNMLLDLTHKQTDGARDNTHSTINDLYYKAVLPMGDGQALTLRANAYSEDSNLTYSGITQAELQNFGIRYNPFKNDEFKTNRFGASATHRIDLSENATLMTNFYGSIFSRDWWRQSSSTTDGQCNASYPLVGGLNFQQQRAAGIAVDTNLCNSAQGRLRDYHTYGVEPRFTLQHNAFGVPSELDAGVRAHYERQQRKQVNGTIPTARTGTIVEDQVRLTQAYSAFATNRFLLGDKWTVTPGIRVESISADRRNYLGSSGKTDLTEWIPALGATFSPTPGTTFFAGAHRGFAPPRVEDLINTPNGAVATFTDVDAERSLNFEVGVRSTIRQGVSLEATAFRNDYSNLIAVGSIASNVNLSQGEALTQGLELAARLDSRELWNTTDNAFLQIAYTWLPTADQETAFVEVANQTAVPGSAAGNRLPYAPENTLTATLGYQFPWGLEALLETVHVGEQFADFGNTAAPSADGQRGLIDAYTIFNLAVNYDWKAADTALFLAVKNLADKEYIVDRTRGVLPGSPRLVQAGLTYRF
ncbi:MAG TPA: TonB-dependent receptor [Burkholderiales bacterium]|nr:TonB-dependent receptor [Burkholderiales bacterium]